MTPSRRVVLWARTARHLRPPQVLHRARLRAQRAAVAVAPGAIAHRLSSPVLASHGWPLSFVPLDASHCVGDLQLEDLVAGRFRFLGQTRELGVPPDWRQPEGARLWRFHLHYLEWAWTLRAGDDRPLARREFARLWRSWHQGTPFGGGDGWAPYVASLRAWAMCGVYAELVAESEIEGVYLDSLAVHAGFLRTHLELDVGGNHLVKNLKALIGLGVFLGDDPMVAKACARLDRQLALQVLGDGGHYERSPSYHCQVLGDLIDLCGLLDAAGAGPSPALDDAVAAMRRWLGVMVMPDGDVPLFNDGWLVGPKRVRLLGPTPPEAGPLTVLSPSGYAVARPGSEEAAVHLVADVGRPCPPELPAHAHAGCLSFELAVGGRRTVVNAGTSTYEPGAVREYERSTRGHNTVEIDGTDQTEVWSTFRAARRATPTLERIGEHEGAVEIVASHDGYRRLPGRPVHRRSWTVAPSRIEIVDEIEGVGRHTVVSSVHLAPGCDAVLVGAMVADAGPLRLDFEASPGATLDLIAPGAAPDGWAATGFGARVPASTVRARVDAELPVLLRTTLTLQGRG